MYVSREPPSPSPILSASGQVAPRQLRLRARAGRQWRIARHGPPPHVVAWWHAATLDRQLAAGVDPQASAVLARRARKLTTRRRRQHVASGLARALRSAQDHRPAFTAAVQPRAQELIAAQPVLACLGHRLRSAEPVTAQGMVMLGALLTDAASPLYQRTEPGTLASRLRAAAAALTPSDPWA